MTSHYGFIKQSMVNTEQENVVLLFPNLNLSITLPCHSSTKHTVSSTKRFRQRTVGMGLFLS